MEGVILQLTFVATRRAGVRMGSPAENPQLMAKSRKTFENASITGLLLVKWPRLLYFLEGEEEKVMRVFSKIDDDPRVHGVVILRRQIAHQRAFPKWDFAVEPDGLNGVGKPLVEQVKELVARVPADIAQNFLAFARLAKPKAA